MLQYESILSIYRKGEKMKRQAFLIAAIITMVFGLVQIGWSQGVSEDRIDRREDIRDRREDIRDR